MGACVCKEEEERNENAANEQGNNPTHSENLGEIKSLAETVDKLVNETLEVIGTIIDK